LLRFYLREDLTDAELGRLARLARGSTPAMVEGWTKEALAVARTVRRPLQFSDLLEQMLPRDERTVEDIRTIALHEIGHAIVAHRLGIRVERVSIIANDDSGGHTKTLMASIVPTWERICDIVTTTLGGRAADIVLGSGPNAGAESDLANATSILLSAIERQGLRGGLVYMPAMGMRRSEVMTLVEAQLTRLLKRSIAIVEADRKLAIKLAERLIEERILSGVDIASALDAGLQEPKRRARTTGASR
ncbi:MAG: hypothetical protein ABI398_04365, partial [Devosia sp.]